MNDEHGDGKREANLQKGGRAVYCTTAPLDRYVMLLDRTPRTRMMMSHSICSKDFCDPWYTHPKKYYLLSVHLLLSGFVPSEPPTMDKVCPWLLSTDLATSARPVALITVERMWKMQWKQWTIGS